jgi:hypothetical protein
MLREVNLSNCVMGDEGLQVAQHLMLIIVVVVVVCGGGGSGGGGGVIL